MSDDLSVCLSVGYRPMMQRELGRQDTSLRRPRAGSSERRCLQEYALNLLVEKNGTRWPDAIEPLDQTGTVIGQAHEADNHRERIRPKPVHD